MIFNNLQVVILQKLPINLKSITILTCSHSIYFSRNNLNVFLFINKNIIFFIKIKSKISSEKTFVKRSDGSLIYSSHRKKPQSFSWIVVKYI